MNDGDYAIIIGSVSFSGQLYDKMGKQIGPRFSGDNDEEVTGRAKAWFATEKEYYPDGLELRIR